ncbi:MAG: DUF4474 domain-containing protein [Lachnospiraceae bacterium]|jgi:hypothetical protein|nr:DUF4474 domain-containing protein [Lachnospiraceae bacterium]
MYFFIGFLVVICLIFVCLRARKRPCCLKRTCSLSHEEKCEKLAGLIEPSGFDYEPCQDIFVSRTDAWQRRFGYCSFFDRTAPLFQMVFDCETVYFDYDGQTWLLELWKGQYGINTGCEIGLYTAGRLLAPHERKNALFQVPEEFLLPMRVSLHREGHQLFALSRCHWWLAGFTMGLFSEPSHLQMIASVTFPEDGMLCACTGALRELGYGHGDLCVEGRTVTICFCRPRTPQPQRHFPLTCAFSQWKNRLFCRIYVYVTRPFTRNLDRLVYLCCFLPFAFRKTICIRRPRKRRGRFA